MSASDSSCNDAQYEALRCIERRDWDRLRDLFRRVRSSGFDPSELGLADADECSGLTLLHMACSYRAPLDIVETIVESFPPPSALIGAIDRRGKTALHVAVEYAVSVDVVRYLLAAGGAECAQVRDCKGRTALMFACREIGRHCRASKMNKAPLRQPAASSSALTRDEELRSQYWVELIFVLSLGCPLSVLAQDSEGVTALEHALESEAPLQVIRVLQHITALMMKKVDLWRAKQTQEGGRRSFALDSSRTKPNRRNSVIAQGA